RAAGDDDGSTRREAKEAEDALARLPVPARRRKLERVELQAAGDADARGVGAELDDPARRLLGLHAEPIHVGEDAAEKVPYHPVAWIRPRRDAAVAHDRFDALLSALAQQVRPDLGLHHDEHARPDEAQRAADDEGPVEREIEDRVDVREAAPRDLLAADRGGG